MKLSFTLNKQNVTIDVDPMKRLLDVLREDFNLLGAKEACGEGECGACTVLLDGKPVTSCILNAIHAEGKEIETVEGISKTELGKLIIDCFDETNAVQCGFCFPGFYTRNRPLPGPPEQQVLNKIKKALSGNICRCTGYKKIFESVMLACKRTN